MKFFWITALLTFSSIAMADPFASQSPDAATLDSVSKHNAAQALLESDAAKTFSFESSEAYELFRSQEVRPFAEYEETGYLIFSAENYRGNVAKHIKRQLAESLPEGVKLIVYTSGGDKNYLNRIKSEYLQHVSEDRLIVLKIPRSGSNDFWTRDNLPLPVWTQDQFTLVDARYYYNFEPDAFLIDLFQSLSTKHSYFFEGGNFIANSRGECIVVNRRRSYPGGVSDTAAIPDSIFAKHYGCKKLTRLRHLKGIGHADEVVKFMTDDIVVTDTPSYAKRLQDLGYEVHLLPEPNGRYETYVNSLQVNDTLFVPTFGQPGNDTEAQKVYESLNLGLKIVTIPTRRLANRGQGGIHCITMNYPPVEIQNLMALLKATSADD